MRKLLGFTIGSVLALSMCNAYADPAVVIMPGPTTSCGVLAADGTTVILSNNAQIVSTQSRNANIVVKCQLGGVPNDTGAAVRFDFENTGLLCVILDPLNGLRVTEDWFETLSAGGIATVICRDTA